jgi:eukaryotic-like serine/threonine-protein kinase
MVSFWRPELPVYLTTDLANNDLLEVTKARARLEKNGTLRFPRRSRDTTYVFAMIRVKVSQNMPVTLTVKDGPHQGRAFEFEEHDTFIVGRSARAQFRLPLKDPSLSRVHFMVEVNPPKCRLTDLGSTNGTKVNGRKISAADLVDGDLIEAGQTVLLFSMTVERVMTVPDRETKPSRSDVNIKVASEPFAPTVDYKPAAIDSEGGRDKSQPVKGYEIVRELGRGGMGVVYLAYSNSADGLVALKTVQPEVAAGHGQVERFIREQRILQELDHPHIVPFHEMGEAEGLLFFSMEYVRGSDAWRVREQRDDGIPTGRAARWVCQLLQALDYAHAKGFVHRDIKPPIMLLEQEGDRETVKLADFGLARAYQTSTLSGVTMKGDVAGTIAFMTPEQVNHLRESQPPVDLYAAGASLYWLLTGRKIYDPPRGLSRQILMVLQDPPVPIRSRRPDLPARLAPVIDRSLAREPDQRFADAKDMRRALLPFR